MDRLQDIDIPLYGNPLLALLSKAAEYATEDSSDDHAFAADNVLYESFVDINNDQDEDADVEDNGNSFELLDPSEAGRCQSKSCSIFHERPVIGTFIPQSPQHDFNKRSRVAHKHILSPLSLAAFRAFCRKIF